MIRSKNEPRGTKKGISRSIYRSLGEYEDEAKLFNNRFDLERLEQAKDFAAFFEGSG